MPGSLPAPYLRSLITALLDASPSYFDHFEIYNLTIHQSIVERHVSHNFPTPSAMNVPTLEHQQQQFQADSIDPILQKLTTSLSGILDHLDSPIPGQWLTEDGDLNLTTLSLVHHAFSLAPRFLFRTHAFSLVPTLSLSYHTLLPRFHTHTTLSHSRHTFSLVPRFVSFTDHAFSLIPRFPTRTTLSQSCHAFSLPPRFYTLATLSLSCHTFSLVPPRFVSFTDHAFSLIPRFPTRTTLSQSCHAFSLPPRFHTLATLSLSCHAFSLPPRFHTRTTLSHSYHAFSLLPCFLTLATLSHSYHAFSPSHPRFFLTNHSPQFSAPTTTFIFYHGFYLACLSSPFSAAAATTFIFHHSFSLHAFPHVQLRYQK